MLNDRVLNAFADNLVTRFARRATGQDDESVRLVGTRPSDHVLTGFLTPVRPGVQDLPTSPDEEDVEASANEQFAQDLPRDAAYEQSSTGMHWLVPRSAFQAGSSVATRISLSVYVRRLPTRLEQSRAIWSIPRDIARSQSRDASTRLPRMAEAIPVWTREDIADLSAPAIDLGRLLQERRLQFSLATPLQDAISARPMDSLYPGRRALSLRESDVASDDAYTAWRSSLAAGQWPLGWLPVLDVRLSTVPTEPDVFRVTVRLINRTEPAKRQSFEYVDPNLYAVRIRLTLPTGAHRSTVFRELPHSFRYDRSMPAVGINAQATLGNTGGAITLETDPVPRYTAQRLVPRDIPNAVPRFTDLASDPVPLLRRIVDAMRAYDADVWETTVGRLTAVNERSEAERARERFRDEIARFSRGVELLADPRFPHVLRAFVLMNRAMSAASRGRYSEWRLFQIVFVVSQLPGLAARQYADLAADDDDHVDVLWFAAGGGKTEAFLGLILWQAFFDRLRGKTIGVAAFVRFPLRLLTFQQLQRLGGALAAAEELRRAERLGGARFSIGYFVGKGTTPNSINDETHRRYTEHGPDPKNLRVFVCPFCGAATRLAYAPDQRLVEHRCTAAEAGCPNGNTRLPIYVVDTDLYRFVPTVIVSTVDKLALLGHNQRFSQLLGRISVVCPEHGASFLGANSSHCSAVAGLDRGERPAQCGTRALEYGPFHDLAPSLLIQDELHLLTEELGTFDAHYETGVAEVVRSNGGRPWKVIGATATIERFQDHAWHLYLRNARQFPGPGPQAFDSFYYLQSSDKVGRIFIGLLGVGRKHTPSVSRALALMYLELQRARELATTDVAEANRRYGLGQLDKRAIDRLIFLYELVLTYVLTRKGSDQVAEAIESRVKKDIREVSPEHGELLVDTFNGGVSEADMSAAVQKIRTATADGSPQERLRGIVATNVIGHGVDVDRFNIILFAGFPRLVAEYIQASARVGRTFPGISIFVATPQSERDRSIFDRFAKFHEYLDRLVDPSAITRWPEPAMRRTVPGLLAGYLMGVAAPLLGRRFATVEQIQDAQGAEALLMSSVVAWAERAYGSERAPSTRYREQLHVAIQNRYSSVINQPRIHGARQRSLNTHLGAMQSLRDTDDPALITLRPGDAPALRRLTGG